MKRLTTFLIFGIISLFLFSCGGGGGAGSADVPPGVNPGQVSLLKLMPDRNVAQTGSFAFFHARVLDSNGMPIPGKTVNFTNMTAGVTVSSPTAVTDRDGIAKVSVRMTYAGYATIIAEAEGHRDRRSVLFSNLNSIRGFALNPIIITLDADRNLNGIYNESDDFRVCQGANTNVVRVRATAYVMGVRTGGLIVGISSDYPTLITFPNTPLFDATTNTYYLTTNSQGEATVDVTVNCQLQPNELLFNIFAITDSYYIEDFNLSFRGTGGMSLFLQPVTITGINLTADPSTAMINGTSNIRAVVNTSIGPAPDNTSVQLYTTCGTISPTPAMTLNGAATAVFTAPSYIPQGGTCSVVARVGSQTATVNITITGQLRVDPSALTINGTTGGVATFTVSGGIPGYSIYSNNAEFAPVPTALTTSGSNFTVTVPANTGAQTVTFTIRDSQANSVTATLTITAAAGGGGTALSVNPSAVSLASTESATFVVSGGTAPYTVTSSRPTLVTVTSPVATNGGTFTATVVGTVSANTTVTITVRDSVGAIVTVTLTVVTGGGTSFSVTPLSLTLSGTADATDNVTFTINGGTAPYVVTSSNAVVIPPPVVAGTNFTITPNPVGTNTTVTLTVIDNTGRTTTASVTVTPLAGSLTVNPATIQMTNGSSTTFYIIGGTGPFNVVSGNGAQVTVNGGATASLGVGVRSFTVAAIGATPVAGITITVIDTVGGASATSTVIVP